MQQDNESVVRFLLEESRAQAREHGNKQALGLVLCFLGQAAIEQGEYAQARSLLEESLALFREQHKAEDIPWALLYLGHVLFAQGNAAYAFTLVENSLHLFREIQMHVGVISALSLLGRLAFAQNEMTQAQTWLEEALALSRAREILEPAAYVLSQLACIAFLQGNQATAVAWWEESLALLQQGGYDEILRLCLQQAGSVMAQQGEVIWAARLWGAADALAEGTGRRSPFLSRAKRTDAEQATYEHQVSASRTCLGKHAFAKAWEEGSRMTPEQALAAQGKALISPPSSPEGESKEQEPATSIAWHELTARELEVLRLVAQGLSDAQIAESLVISSRTVHAHLRSIYGKLNISSRHTATRYVFKHHLI
jgi:ATP/maltotriose-dependent transcriptional regulator MalT